MKQGHFICLTIEDSGTGISAEVMPRIFEPFFSTKFPGEGSGLGLSVVYGIVQEHQGFIHVHSQPGKGSVFQLFFPVSDEIKAGFIFSKIAENEKITVTDEDIQREKEIIKKAMHTADDSKVLKYLDRNRILTGKIFSCIKENARIIVKGSVS